MATTALIHIKGNKATIQLTEDVGLEGWGEPPVPLNRDPIAQSLWIKKRSGQWLFNDQPTGSYTPSARKAARLLSAAIRGSTLTQPGALEVIESFCANEDSTHVTTIVTDNAPFYSPDGGPWFVAGGLSAVLDKPGPPFDAQGNPQGALSVIFPYRAEWSVKLVSGKIVAISTYDATTPLVVARGTAGC